MRHRAFRSVRSARLMPDPPVHNCVDFLVITVLLVVVNMFAVACATKHPRSRGPPSRTPPVTRRAPSCWARSPEALHDDLRLRNEFREQPTSASCRRTCRSRGADADRTGRHQERTILVAVLHELFAESQPAASPVLLPGLALTNCRREDDHNPFV